jgi:hypothetical protein
MIAREGQHTDEQLGILVEARVGRRQLPADLRCERVLLLDAIDGHDEDPIVDDVGPHLPVGMTLHGGRTRIRLHDATDSTGESYIMQPTRLRWWM